MSRGEIWWCDFPRMGRRPVLILTRTPAIALLNRILVAPLTTTARDIPTEVPVGPPDGLREPSVVTLDNVRSVHKRSLGARVTQLSESRMDEVCEALRYALAC